jgi:hypothetical protein
MDFGFWAGLLLSIVGVVVGVVGWLRPRRYGPIPIWRTVARIPLVRPEVTGVDELQVAFRGRTLPQLSAWTGKFWNVGQAPIRRSDLQPGTLSFHFTGAEIIAATVTAHSRQEIAFSLAFEEHQSEIRFGFEFLDYKDGAEFTVFHTGHVGLEPTVAGAVVGSAIRKAIPGSINQTKRPPASSIIWIAAFVAQAAVTYFLVNTVEKNFYPDATLGVAVADAFSGWKLWFFVTIGVLLFVLWMSIYVFEYRMYLERKGEPFFGTTGIQTDPSSAK